MLFRSTTASYTMGGATINGNTTIGSSSNNKHLTVNGNTTISGSLLVNNLSIYNSIIFCGGMVNSGGTIQSTYGITYTVSKISGGVYQINFSSAHPSGANPYMVIISPNAFQGYSMWNYSTTTNFRVNLFLASTNTASGGWFSFTVYR